MSDDMETYNEIEEEMSIDINNDNDGSTTMDNRNDNSEEVPDWSSDAFSEKLSTAIIRSEIEDLDNNDDRDIPSPVESESRYPLLDIESEQWLGDWMMINQELMKVIPLQNNKLQSVAPHVYNKIIKWMSEANIRNNEQCH